MVEVHHLWLQSPHHLRLDIDIFEQSSRTLKSQDAAGLSQQCPSLWDSLLGQRWNCFQKYCHFPSTVSLHPHIELVPSTPHSKRFPWGPTETPSCGSPRGGPSIGSVTTFLMEPMGNFSVPSSVPIHSWPCSSLKISLTFTPSLEEKFMPDNGAAGRRSWAPWTDGIMSSGFLYPTLSCVVSAGRGAPSCSLWPLHPAGQHLWAWSFIFTCKTETRGHSGSKRLQHRLEFWMKWSCPHSCLEADLRMVVINNLITVSCLLVEDREPPVLFASWEP